MIGVVMNSSCWGYQEQNAPSQQRLVLGLSDPLFPSTMLAFQTIPREKCLSWPHGTMNEFHVLDATLKCKDTGKKAPARREQFMMQQVDVILFRWLLLRSYLLSPCFGQGGCDIEGADICIESTC
jgi:hypothetical protein